MNARAKRRICTTACALTLVASAFATALPSRAEEEQRELFTSLVIDQLEHRWQEGDNAARWDVEGWAGGDTNRVWMRGEGEQRTSGPSRGDLEIALFYGRHVAAFWDLLVGVRQDVVYGARRNRERTLFALSAEGLAPYRIELEPSLYVSDDGDVSARLTATTDWFVTQRLIAQPRVEINAAASDARAYGVRSGVNDIELGLRLRYEIRREIAPYLGVSWVRRLGDTAEFARSQGDRKSDTAVVLGLRLWL